MGFYLDQDGNYYEGDKEKPQDVEVIKRPSSDYAWNGTSWDFDLGQYKVKKVLELDNLYSKWWKFETTLSMQNIFTSYSNTVTLMNNGMDAGEVDAAYNNNYDELFGL